MEDTGALTDPIRRRIVEYVLETEDHERAMVLLTNEIARFKAANGYGSDEEIRLNAVRRELEGRHFPRLERAGLLAYSGEKDRVALAASPAAVRAELERADLDDDA